MDNAPPPEPQDVRAHLHGGIPLVEVDALQHYWDNYAQLRGDLFVPREGTTAYLNFSAVLQDKRDIADFVTHHHSVVSRHAAFMQTLEEWWQANLPIVEALAPDADNQDARPRNVYVMRTGLLSSIEQALAGQNLLTRFQVRGAFANYVDRLKADFKSIAASGWGAELIPDEEILQSQFPAVLAELEQAQSRMAELQALFAAASEEDFEDSDDLGVLPADEVSKKKDDLKQLNADWKAQLKTVKDLAGNIFTELKAAGLLPAGAKKGDYCTDGFTAKEPQFANGQRILDLAAQAGFRSEYASALAEAMRQGQQAYQRSVSVEASLARHTALEDELKAVRATIKGIEGRRDELVESARRKISTDEARQVIIARLRALLLDIYQSYLRAEQRTCIKAIENLWAKYRVTAREIETQRDTAATQLQAFLSELGYE